MPLPESIANVPQSDADTIARRLLGDQLVDRFGDALGTRERTAADVARDFAVGFTEGAEGNRRMAELRLQAQEQFSKQLARAQDQARADQRADQQRVGFVLDAIKTVQGLPPGQRASILKEALESIGVRPSAAAIKMFTDADAISQLDLFELDKAHQEGLLSTADVAGVFGSGLNAAKALASIKSARARNVEIGKDVIEKQRSALKLDQERRQADIEDELRRQRVPQKKAKLGLKQEKAKLRFRRRRLKGLSVGGSETEQAVRDLGGGDTNTPGPATGVQKTPGGVTFSIEELTE